MKQSHNTIAILRGTYSAQQALILSRNQIRMVFRDDCIGPAIEELLYIHSLLANR
jgi:hypothetical protein